MSSAAAKSHTHVAIASREVGFTAQVGGHAAPLNRAAHGNRTRIETCSCGLIRETNFNGQHEEVGNWFYRAPAADSFAGFAGLSRPVVSPDVVVNPTVVSRNDHRPPAWL